MRCERAVNFDPRDSCVSFEAFLVSIRSISDYSFQKIHGLEECKGLFLNTKNKTY